jgi:hypothetical protein
VGRKRLAKIHQILLVKIAKLRGRKWGNVFASGLARVAISEGGRWVVVVDGELCGWKYPRLSLVHTRICARDKTQYRRRINLYSPGIKLIAGAYPIYSPGVKITLEGVAPAHIIPGAYEIYSPVVSQLPDAYGLYAPGINIPMGLLSRCGPTSQYHWRI